MEKRINISTGAPWEDIVGYSRAVRIADLIEVSGTTATDQGEVVGKGDYYKQTKFILEKIIAAIEKAGGKVSDIVRTRIYVRDIKQWEAVAKAHFEFLGSIKPATSMVEVSALIDEDLLVEIEATAMLNS